jgi:hypothetical protein
MQLLSLRGDLFLLAHDESGRPQIATAGLEAGLAGATLIDLLIASRVAVVDGRLDVIDPEPTGDDEADATVAAIRSNTAPCGPRAWVSWISSGAYQRVAESLCQAGVVAVQATRRLGLLPVQRFVAADPDELVRIRARLRYALHGREVPDPQTAALCGLVRVLRLEPALLLSMPTSDLLLGLERLNEASDVPVRLVTNAVDAVITNATFR